jgi:hypothetical protein
MSWKLGNALHVARIVPKENQSNQGFSFGPSFTVQNIAGKSRSICVLPEKTR